MKPQPETIAICLAFGVERRKKGDWKPQHLWIPILVWIAGLFSPDFKQKFYEEFHTLIGRTLYEAPFISNGGLRHELIHVVQSVRDRWFKTRWVFVPSFRASSEIEAYAEQMLEDRAYGRPINVTAYARVVSGKMYFWPISYENAVKALEALAGAILDGSYSSPLEDQRTLYATARAR